MQGSILNCLLLLIAGISCVVIGYLLLREIKDNHAIESVTKNLIEKTFDAEQKRKNREEQLQIEEGNREKMNLIYRFDLIIEKSGIKRKLTFMNTEIFIITVAGSSIIVGILSGMIFHNMLYEILIIAIYLFLVYIMMFLLVTHNSKVIEENLLQFSDLLESYSAASDDIIDIFEKTAEYLDEPLYSAIKKCVMEARTDGNIQAAFQRLKIRVGNRKLSELLSNIEECSNNNADYGGVVRRIHDSIETYITEKEERKKLAAGAKKNILLMVLVFLYSIKVVQDFIGMNVFIYLQKTPMGKIILIFGFGVTLFVIYKLVVMGKK